ncbi:hypothetical protein HF521_020802 [Silurus meridionalis]|uniref:EMI domain-containing protein n=1 Tax=Silurus meridionalis TaxID=175797 RepID=A0A8T0BJ21_SILME|nr:hypothetical protein HF521_020802 [Silurus meridionalis]
MLPVCFCVRGRGMDITVLMLLLAMLQCSYCFSELRARDPDVEEKEKAELKSNFSPANTMVPLEYEHLSRSGQMDTQVERPEKPLTFLSESLHQPAGTGNWCTFVHQRLINTAELSGAEEHKERQKKKTNNALYWKCCPGHGGYFCQETVASTRIGQPHTESTPTDVSPDDNSDSGNAGAIPPSPSSPSFPSMPFMDSSSMAIHQIFAAVMTQLQPVLNGFNHTLENLSRKVEDFSVELNNLKNEQESMSKTRHAHEEKYKKDLEDNLEQIHQIWTELDSQQKEIEQTVHLQQERLLHNMTSLQDRIYHCMNVSHEEIQVSLESLNKSMEEIQLNHERLQETTEGEHDLTLNASESQSQLETSMWEAISSLDMKVLNNTMELIPLTENSKHLINIVQKLDHNLRNLSQHLEYISHNTEVHLAQIGLEVEAARVGTQKIVNELASNHSTLERDLRDIQLDVDNIYQHVQNNELATVGEVCSCKEISESLIKLESKVTNVTNLAKENQYALEDVEAKKGLGQWPLEVEDLRQGLWSVRESLAFEQVKRKTLYDNLAQLKSSLQDSQKEITGLKGQFVAKEAEIRHISASFTSLLKDAIRHSDVLEVLLGDEVMEFTSWTESQQKELAIPVLLQKMRLMQEKIDSHDYSLTTLRKNSASAQMTNDDPVAFTEWSLTKDQGSNTEDQRDILTDISRREDDDDYSVSDFWSLGKEVEQLANRLSMLEQQPCNCTAAPSGVVMELQRDFIILQQTLEAHLRTFQTLFVYTEELAGSSGGVNLDQLQTMLRKERKRKKGQNMQKNGETSSMRSKRHTGKE